MVISISEKFKQFSDHWSPKIVAELNGQHVKFAKLKGEFVWHSHQHEDELFLVVSGTLEMHYRDRVDIIKPNEFTVVPKGIEHKPVAIDEVEVILFEPASTLNTGNVENERTRKSLDKI